MDKAKQLNENNKVESVNNNIIETSKDDDYNIFELKEQFEKEKLEYLKLESEILGLRKMINELNEEVSLLELGDTASPEEQKMDQVVKEATDLVENENEEIIQEEIVASTQKLNSGSPLKKMGSFIYKNIKRKFIKYVVLPASLATSVTLSYNTPQEYYGMFKNYKERHFDKKNKDDPSIIGINELYNDTTSVEKSTYDFLGEHKIDYKSGYYMTSVFDLSDRTPPRFKLINDRENLNRIDSAAGITTNLFKKFQKFNEFLPELKGHKGKSIEEIKELAVIGYNTKDQTIKAGHYKEFSEDWLVSETYEIPLDFKLNSDSTINLVYHEQALRMVPLTKNESGKDIPFPIGITYNKKITKINPKECTHFGTLEGGKVIMKCGDKQLQVNGSFADIFAVYERLKKECGDIPVEAYLLDNGSYNLPVWDKDSVITQKETKEHLNRNRDGGTALVLVSDNKISPYEYKNTYKEYQHYTSHFTKDSITNEPIKNQKSVLVLHHTGNYNNPNRIIDEFEGKVINKEVGEVSAHVLILKDGTRHLFNTDDYVLAHAGKSDFNDKNKVNFFSIGVEIEGDTKNGHQFTVAQLESLIEFLRPRIEKYNIPFENITTHKIIRNNYIKKHPGERGVKTKPDLDDKVWSQIQELIKKKVYEKNNTRITKDSVKMVGSLYYRDSYKENKNREYSMKQTEKFLARSYSKAHNINNTMDWIKQRV